MGSTTTAAATPQDTGQLAVALGHQAIVVNALEALGVRSSVADTSPELGLALLNLHEDDVRSTAGSAKKPLDEVLRRLYAHFKQLYKSDWVPTIGKNRTVDRVGAAAPKHNIGGGGEGLPQTLTAEQRPRYERPATGPTPTVAIADTRIYAHPALAGSYLASEAGPFGEVDGPFPYHAGHATFVAGLVLQWAPLARLEIYPVLDENGEAESWELAKRLVRLSRSGVDVLNLSLGCLTDDDEPPLVLATAIDRLDLGTVVVASAGNHAAVASDRPKPMWPAALDDVVAVGAVTRKGKAPTWSQTPERAPWIDVVAPGVDVRSTFLSGAVRLPHPPPPDLPAGDRLPDEFDGYAAWSGTSFAAATVSGAIAHVVAGERDARTALEELRAGKLHADALRWNA